MGIANQQPLEAGQETIEALPVPPLLKIPGFRSFYENYNKAYQEKASKQIADFDKLTPPTPEIKQRIRPEVVKAIKQIVQEEAWNTVIDKSLEDGWIALLIIIFSSIMGLIIGLGRFPSDNLFEGILAIIIGG